MLEKDIEKKVSEYAKKLGWLGTKLNSESARGWPDRLYVRNGVTVFIEFKRKGGRISALQKKRMYDLKQQNMRAYTVWNVEEGKDLFDNLEKLLGASHASS